MPSKALRFRTPRAATERAAEAEQNDAVSLLKTLGEKLFQTVEDRLAGAGGQVEVIHEHHERALLLLLRRGRDLSRGRGRRPCLDGFRHE